MNKIKYISQLSDEEILDLVKIYTKDSFEKLDFLRRCEDGVEVDVIVKLEDDDPDSEEDYMYPDEMYTLTDYNVKVWDYQCNNKRQLLQNYRRFLLNKFGEEYLLDYLLEY